MQGIYSYELDQRVDQMMEQWLEKKDLRFAVPPEARRRISCLIKPLARSSRPCLLYTLRIAVMM